MGGVAVVDVALQVEAAAHALKDIPPQAVTVVAQALRHQMDEQLGPQDKDVQAAIALRRVQAVGRVGDAAPGVQPEVGILPVAGDGGADGGDVRAGVDMAAEHVLQGRVDDRVAVGQHHVVLADALQVVHHAAQGIHAAAELAVAAVLLIIGEGRQQRQTAEVAAQVPAFAAAQVVQQRLALAVHDDAHVRDAGVHHAGEDEVDDAVVTAEGDGAVDAIFDELPQTVFLVVGEDDPVHSVHGRTSLPFSPSIIFGSMTAPSATEVRGPSTAMPQSSKGTLPGAPPTTAFLPTRQPSPTMA